MIGDRLNTYILFGKQGGLATLLVLTGNKSNFFGSLAYKLLLSDYNFFLFVYHQGIAKESDLLPEAAERRRVRLVGLVDAAVAVVAHPAAAAGRAQAAVDRRLPQGLHADRRGGQAGTDGRHDAGLRGLRHLISVSGPVAVLVDRGDGCLPENNWEKSLV